MIDHRRDPMSRWSMTQGLMGQRVTSSKPGVTKYVWDPTGLQRSAPGK